MRPPLLDGDPPFDFEPNRTEDEMLTHSATDATYDARMGSGMRKHFDGPTLEVFPIDSHSNVW